MAESVGKCGDVVKAMTEGDQLLNIPNHRNFVKFPS